MEEEEERHGQEDDEETGEGRGTRLGVLGRFNNICFLNFQKVDSLLWRRKNAFWAVACM